jgi:hypothetical protein
LLLDDDENYECAFCGAPLDVSDYGRSTMTLRARKGEPTIRTISYDGKEVHSCALPWHECLDQEQVAQLAEWLASPNANTRADARP